MPIRRYDNLGKVNTILNVIFTGNETFLENVLSSTSNQGYFSLLINDFVYMNAIAASSTAMNAIAASSTAMNAIVKSQTARQSIASSSYLSSVSNTMYNTCDNDSDKFQKYTVSVAISASTPIRYWTSTSGATTTQPDPDDNIVFVYQVVDSTAYSNTVYLYHLDSPTVVAYSVDLPSTQQPETVNISPYDVLFGGIKAEDYTKQGSANKTVYFYGFKAL